MINTSKKKLVEPEIKNKRSAAKAKGKKQASFQSEFGNWVAEMEKQVESTRQSELLTQNDYAIQINAQG